MDLGKKSWDPGGAQNTEERNKLVEIKYPIMSITFKLL